MILLYYIIKIDWPKKEKMIKQGQKISITTLVKVVIKSFLQY